MAYTGRTDRHPDDVHSGNRARRLANAASTSVCGNESASFRRASSMMTSSAASGARRDRAISLRTSTQSLIDGLGTLSAAQSLSACGTGGTKSRRLPKIGGPANTC